MSALETADSARHPVASKTSAGLRSLAMWTGRDVAEIAERRDDGTAASLIEETREVKDRMAVLDKLTMLKFRRIGWDIEEQR